MHSVALFDDGLGLLSPLTDLRPVFSIRTGALTTLERAALHARLFQSPAPTHLFVPDHLAPLAAEQHALPVNGRATLTDTLTIHNGAAPHAASHHPPIDLGAAIVDTASSRIVAAHIRRDQIDQILAHDTKGLRIIPSELDNVLNRPWHVRKLRDESLKLDLHWLMSAALGLLPRELSKFEFRTHIAKSARVHPSAIFDAELGHIYIDDHAVIRPGAILVGPVYIGPHSTVLERSLIKSGTAIGPHCKVAGEVVGTIFQGYANKSHDGHLGDSWIGEWANLGAGTTNSNLLNTYGDIVCRPLGADGKPAANERTGQQFLGATIGDHVKTAICTRIMTGAIVGTGTMFAASAPLSGTIPPLSWITDSGTKSFAVEKFIEIARTVMARRKLAMTEAYEAQLHTLACMGNAR
jgi:UDP-N-acetylglucosamine diphosphorylase / glucose-1-phosphate thymidylyltransferase / UDP-N-acetylgalactosamine diphosphorylase / glucosamine-1-phosphate N-acetyltransferase / galactosamine-1-phosphate N-acetyltransferase